MSEERMVDIPQQAQKSEPLLGRRNNSFAVPPAIIIIEGFSLSGSVKGTRTRRALGPAMESRVGDRPYAGTASQCHLESGLHGR